MSDDQIETVPITRAASAACEAVMQQRTLAELEASAFVRGLAFGLGIDPARVATIDTDNDQIVLKPLAREPAPDE